MPVASKFNSKPLEYGIEKSRQPAYLQGGTKCPGGCQKAIRLLVGQDAHGDRPNVAHRTADASLRTVGRGVVHGSRQSGASEPSWC